MGDLSIVDDFLPMPMRSFDIILGMKWLALVGKTRDDWENLTMTLTINGKEVVLQGDIPLSRAMVSTKTIRKLLEQKK